MTEVTEHAHKIIWAIGRHPWYSWVLITASKTTTAPGPSLQHSWAFKKVFETLQKILMFHIKQYNETPCIHSQIP